MNNNSWQQIAAKTKTILDNPQTSPQEAVKVFMVWSTAYRNVYDVQKNLPVPPSDIDQIEEKVRTKILPWTDPVDMVLDELIKSMLPRLAAILSLTESAVYTGIWTLLVPTPIASTLQEAQLINEELGKLLFDKIGKNMQQGWVTDYSNIVTSNITVISPPKPLHP